MVGAGHPSAVAANVCVDVQVPGSGDSVWLPGQNVITGVDVTVVTVGLFDPPTSGSSVSTLAKLLPETVPCVESWQTEAGILLLIVTLNLMVVLLPLGMVKPLPVPFTVTVSPAWVASVLAGLGETGSVTSSIAGPAVGVAIATSGFGS